MWFVEIRGSSDLITVGVIGCVEVPLARVAFFAEWLQVAQIITASPLAWNHVVDDEDYAVIDWSSPALGTAAGSEYLGTDALAERGAHSDLRTIAPANEVVSVHRPCLDSWDDEVTAQIAHAPVCLRGCFALRLSDVGSDLDHGRRICATLVEEAVEQTMRLRQLEFFELRRTRLG
jgi:hypothetical protein